MESSLSLPIRMIYEKAMPELAMCPYCGFEAQCMRINSGLYQIYCPHCGARGSINPMPEIAAESWNRVSIRQFEPVEDK